MNDEILELPEVRCPGCDGRDRIIQSLAKEIDRRDALEKAQEKRKPVRYRDE